MHRTLVIASLLVSVTSSVSAESQCTVEPTIVSYYEPKNLPATKDTRCDLKDGKCEKLELKGFLYLPPASAQGKAPHAVIIQNHGSGKTVSPNCEFGSYFAELGYVVLMPMRRGYGESTGVYQDEYIEKYCSKPGEAGFCKMEYLHKQVADIESAISYVKKRSDVDADRIALSGHSFGGIATVFANTQDLGQKAAIDFAGASQSWEGNDEAVAEMLEAVKAAVAPIYFFEPLNDASIGPTIQLAKAAGQNCQQYQSALFPAVDTDGNDKIDAKDYSGVRDPPVTGNHARDIAHGLSTKMLDRWGPSMHEFMTRYFKHPAKKFDQLCKGTSLGSTPN